MRFESHEICEFERFNCAIERLDHHPLLPKVLEKLLKTIFLLFQLSTSLFLRKSYQARGFAVMADRNARSITFNVPAGTNLGDIKTAIENENTDNRITVFQEIGANEYLVELTETTHVQELIESGFDAGSNHIRCQPTHGYYLNVSIIGLKAYISDDEVHEKLAQYSEIKGAIIRLKYKSTHELAGLENGNRLVRMVLTSPSIPYSLNIGGEWCKVIHNHQQLICSHCNEAGHSRKNCPQIQCRNCNQLGHISYHCPLRATQHTETTSDENTPTENITTSQNVTDNNDSNMTMEESTEPIVLHELPDNEQANTSTPEKTIKTQNDEQTKDNSTGETSDHRDVPESNMEQDTVSDILPPNENEENNMDFSINTKRPHQTDSDSDPAPLPHRQRIKPAPNTNVTRNSHKKNKDKNKKQ